MHYTPRTYNPLIQAYAFVAIPLFLVLWFTIQPMAYFVAGLSLGIFLSARLR